jgi:transcriptional regulator with XRE-family HTH domain
VEVNGDTIKTMRQARGWTQQHLADVCDVNLRTIQRVERHGSAANETVHALCAVFEIGREQLSVIPQVEASQLEVVRQNGPQLFVVLALLLGIVIGCGLMYLLVQLGFLR